MRPSSPTSCRACWWLRPPSSRRSRVCLGCIVYRFFWECEDCNDISDRSAGGGGERRPGHELSSGTSGRTVRSVDHAPPDAERVGDVVDRSDRVPGCEPSPGRARCVPDVTAIAATSEQRPPDAPDRGADLVAGATGCPCHARRNASRGGTSASLRTSAAAEPGADQTARGPDGPRTPAHPCGDAPTAHPDRGECARMATRRAVRRTTRTRPVDGTSSARSDEPRGTTVATGS